MAAARARVPKLADFSGDDEDWYSWSVEVYNTLGRAGLKDYLTSESESSDKIASQIFYAIRQAIQSGTAGYKSSELFRDDDPNPYKLWSWLIDHFDTPLNQSNTTVLEIKKLLNLRLGPDTQPNRFISDFKECLLRLQENQAKVADDVDTLRAFLLVAIQNDEFDDVRKDILKKQEESIDPYLQALREQEALLQAKADRSLVSDSVSRRAGYQKPSSTESSSSKWNMPRIPDSWCDMLGKKVFNLLVKWRSQAMSGASQKDLDRTFAVQRAEYNPKKKGKARRGKTPETPDESEEPPKKMFRFELAHQTEASKALGGKVLSDPRPGKK